MTGPGVHVRRAAERFTTRLDWLDSRHSFSFGAHYDPGNTHHGVLLVNNEDVVAAGCGFETHPHRDMEIVTWVLSGALLHEDSAGHSGVVHPGLVQRMSAGSGVVHSERAEVEPVHFVQMWVQPDETGADPDYEQLDVTAELARGDLAPVASGIAEHDAAIRIRNRSAALHAARLSVQSTVQLPEAAYVHLFVTTGRVDLEGTGALDAGDAVRLTATGGQRVTATDSAEILVWEMHPTGRAASA